MVMDGRARYKQRFGIWPEAIARHPQDYQHLLSTLQMAAATAWATDLNASYSEIAARIGSTPQGMSSLCKQARKRLTQRAIREQSHRPLLDKITTGGPPSPEATAAAMKRLTQRQASILGAAMAAPEETTGEIAARLGIHSQTVSGSMQRLRSAVAYVKSKMDAKYRGEADDA
ncbi:MAG: helix-turn-helix domain-containing protein [Planctomycetota bacterium]